MKDWARHRGGTGAPGDENRRNGLAGSVVTGDPVAPRTRELGTDTLSDGVAGSGGPAFVADTRLAGPEYDNEDTEA